MQSCGGVRIQTPPLRGGVTDSIRTIPYRRWFVIWPIRPDNKIYNVKEAMTLAEIEFKDFEGKVWIK
jgi:hypothetical protein